MKRTARNTSDRPSPATRKVVLVRECLDALEPRAFFAIAPWGAAPRLIGLDDVATNSPTLLGTGQTVAVLDTGIDYTNPALGGGFGAGKKVIGGYDFVDNDDDPMDTNGHGTAVAGVIAADEFEDGGFEYRGIAPGAKLVAVRIGSDSQAIPLERIERALQWVLDNATAYHITAVNLSFGFGSFATDYNDSIFNDELHALADRQIAFVSSSGNLGVADGQGITYPAASSFAYSVGSVASNDLISEFTQRSPNLDLLAPGEAIHSTALGGGFGTFSGTSFAAPVVAGAFAVVRQIDPTYTLGDVASMLRAGAVSNYDGDGEIGATTGLTFNRIDLERTLAIAEQRQSAASPAQLTIGVSGNRSQYVVDSFGVGHFVYYDDAAKTMKYAVRNASGNWSAPTTIDTRRDSIGTEMSLKLDAQDRPRLAYLDGPNGDLRFGWLDDGTWRLETLDEKGVVGIYPSLAIGSDGTMYVAYLRKTNADLKLTTWSPYTGEWTRQTIDADYNVGYSANLVLDRDGRVAVTYGDETNNQLRLIRQNLDGTWTKTIVDGDVHGAAYASLAFNDGNLARISYYEVQSSDLKFAAEQSDNTFKLERLASRGATGLFTSLSLDELDNATILYWDRRTNTVQRARGSGTNLSSFSFARVASGGRYLTTSLSAFDGTTRYIASDDDRLTIRLL